jgi:hypothetical protein
MMVVPRRLPQALSARENRQGGNDLVDAFLHVSSGLQQRRLPCLHNGQWLADMLAEYQIKVEVIRV